MIRVIRNLLAPVVVVVCVIGGCDHEGPRSTAPQNAQYLPPPPVPARGEMGSTMTQPTSTGPLAPAPSYGPQSIMIPGSVPNLAGLDDAQIAGVVQAIHQADIEHLEIALTRATASQVQGFARDGIQVHRAAAEQDQTDLGLLKIVPATSSVSLQVLADWQRDRQAMRVTPDLEFDRTFVAHHVALDLEAVALLDAAIAQARGIALRNHLLSDRTVVAGHLREAQHVEQTLGSQTP